MTLPPADTVREVMTGRQVLMAAIDIFERRAAWAHDAAEDYAKEFGPGVIDTELTRTIALDRAAAVALGILLAKGATPLESMPKDKPKEGKLVGEPSFASRLRYQTTQEIVQLVAGALRSAFAAAPAMPALNDETKNAA